MKTGSWSTQKLAAEAAALEARLTALKLALQQDKAKREAAAVLVTGGKDASMWSNGKQGPLRKAAGLLEDSSCHAGVGKARTPSAGSAQPRSTSSKPGMGNTSSTRKAPAPRMATPGSSKTRLSKGVVSDMPMTNHNTFNSIETAASRPSSSSSVSSQSSSIDTRSSDTPVKNTNTKPQWLKQLKQQQQQQQQQPQPATPVQLGQTAAQMVDVRGPLQPHAVAGHASTPGAERGQGQTGAEGYHRPSEPCDDSAPSLLQGSYDEAAAANSFQDALRQWRQAAVPSETETEMKSSRTNSDGSAADAARSLSNSLQGSTSTSNGAGTARHSSTSTAALMDAKLGSKPVNTSVAAFLQKLSSRNNSQAATQPNTDAALNSSPVASVPSSSCCASSDIATENQRTQNTTTAGANAAPALAASMAEDAERGCPDSPLCCGSGMQDAAGTTECVGAFDEWLQQAEQVVASLAAPGLGPEGTGISHGSSSSSITLPTDIAATELSPAARYHSQLDSMLQAIEDMETELQKRKL